MNTEWFGDTTTPDTLGPGSIDLDDLVGIPPTAALTEPAAPLNARPVDAAGRQLTARCGRAAGEQSRAGLWQGNCDPRRRGRGLCLEAAAPARLRWGTD